MTDLLNAPSRSDEAQALGSRAVAFPLTDEQRAIVEHGDGPLVVIAGAGTGKTRVIVERIAWLLETKQELLPEQLLVPDVQRQGRTRAVRTFTESATWMSTARTDADLAAARADILARTAPIRGGDFAATPSGDACRWCDYAPLCPSRA